MVFKPIKGEVIDGIVLEISRPGIHLQIGSVKAFIPHNKIPAFFEFDEESKKFVNKNERLNIIEKKKVNVIR